MYDRRLEAISAAAELGSFSRAAAKLRVSTPALVKQVSGFEAEFGITLFERSHSGVKVTPAGALLRRFPRSPFCHAGYSSFVMISPNSVQPTVRASVICAARSSVTARRAMAVPCAWACR